MKCEEVRDELVAYARGELAPDGRRAVEEHLVRCAGCTKELEGTRQVMALTRMADDESIADLVQRLMVAAITGGASDIHLERHSTGPRVRLRIDGVLQEGPPLTAEQYEPVVARIKILAGLSLSERRIPQDGRMGLNHSGKDYDLRICVAPYIWGEHVVIRILDKTSIMLGLDRLGLYPEHQAQLEAMAGRPNGLVILTGPTGNGKTTTLYSMLHHINTPQRKIMTVEDPVEYQIPGVNQAHVNRTAGCTFPSLLRAIMRQDPNVVMVGEIRDLETAEMCLQLAMTGHLVLTSLHAGNAVGAVVRLEDMGIEPFMVASSLVGVVGQRLVRQICAHCKEAYQPAEATLRALGFSAESRPEAFYRGAGCERCRNSGYRGRTGLFEILRMTPELANKVAEQATGAEIRAFAEGQGLLYTFQEDARRKTVEGITTVEEAGRMLMGVFG